MRFERAQEEVLRISESISRDIQSRRMLGVAACCAMWILCFGVYTPWTVPVSLLILIWGLTPSRKDVRRKVAELRAKTSEAVEGFLAIEAPDLDLRN